MRLVALLTAALCAAPALAADIVSKSVDVPGWNQRLEDARRICSEAPEGVECTVAATAVQADLATAITVLSRTRDIARVRPAARKLLALDPPGIQTAAAYALARLGPEDEDTPRLVALLNSPVPTVRRAAWGALRASADPAAREWAARGQYQGRGERFTDDVRPLDAEALQIEPPPGTTPVWLEMEVWTRGVQVFTADGDPGAVITHFSGLAGQGSRPLAEVADWFQTDDNARAAYERFGNAAWFQTPYVIPLAFDEAGDRPIRVAVVWYDLLFGKTGFALQWLPASTMPGRSQQPWRASTDLPLKLADRPGEAELSTREKPGADKLDTDAYLSVLMGDGTGADTYLKLFQEGAYRAEVEALKSEPRVEPVEHDLVEPTSVNIRFANMPTGEPVRFDIVSHAWLFSEADSQWPKAPPPQEAVAAPEGAASGEITWTGREPLAPGLYEIRVFVGPDEMEFDAWSLRRAVPGRDAHFFRTIRILPRLAEVATDKQIYAPGEPVRVAYAEMPVFNTSSRSYRPFITLVKADAPQRAWQQYKYTEAETGELKLEAPMTPGDYQVRVLFQEDGFVRGVADITVGDLPRATPEPTPVPTPTPAPTPVPEDMNVVIALSKPAFAPDEQITGKVTGLSGDRDWIAVVPAGAEDGTTGQWVRAPRGETEAEFVLPGQPAGAYEIRVRFHDQYRPVRRRLAFEVK